MKKILRKMKKSLKKFGSLIFLLFSINRNLNFNCIMNTNTLNKHLEDKSLSDITNIIKEIVGILDKYDEEYNIRHQDFYLLKIEKFKGSKHIVAYEDKLCKINNLQDMLRHLLKDRYFDRILKTRTENLLKKVELLD